MERVSESINQSCQSTGKVSRVGCRVDMTDVPTPKLIIDFDKPRTPLSGNEVRCDYFLVSKDQNSDFSWVAVLELKAGSLKTSQAVKQLQAGASAVEKLISKGEAIRFRPVVVCRGMHNEQIKILREKSNHIKLHEKKEPIRHIRCGSKLMNALK